VTGHRTTSPAVARLFLCPSVLTLERQPSLQAANSRRADCLDAYFQGLRRPAERPSHLSDQDCAMSGPTLAHCTCSPRRHSNRRRAVTRRNEYARLRWGSRGADATCATNVIPSRDRDGGVRAVKESRVLWRRLHGTGAGVLALNVGAVPTSWHSRGRRHAARRHSIRSGDRMPRPVSYLTAHATSVGSFCAGCYWRTLGGGYAKNGVPGCAIGYAKNGVPFPEGTPNGVV
jgi:hypothetical protein